MALAAGEEYYGIVNSVLLKYKDIFEKNTTGTDQDHTDFCTQFITKITSGSDNYLDPCLKVLKWLNYSKEEANMPHKSEHCKYLNYWLRDTLKNIEYNEYKTSEFYKKMESEKKNYTSLFNICKEEIQDIDDLIFKNIKSLYQLYTIFNTFKINHLNSINNYCIYGKMCVQLYSEYGNSCSVDNINEAFCKQLLNFKEEYNGFMEPHNICSEVQKTLPNPGAENDVSDSEEGEGYEPYQELPGSGFGFHSGSILGQMGYIKFNILIAFVIMLIISSISFILYKFTPFGLLLRPHIQMIRNKMLNAKDEEQPLLGNYENKSMNFQNNPHNVQYHSLRN
ncbi:PIR Superfamily Protein [Plasmodium ovale wallikeri]|uniref:PIR Superfamily Protein n=2 Tax=Plasmodium ovale TaxID=36330 RepID=A0A1A9AS01_PLAOA|nr:PIR Superfamily Protein [Plasmodium ovale wallikeri]SBT58901.1 PIR Superfamily Protein [Plasmodium ovale wallikeri]SBT73352.1 Plasmodium vivax Vir protein, putative [Plasmodium ovale]